MSNDPIMLSNLSGNIGDIPLASCVMVGLEVYENADEPGD